MTIEEGARFDRAITDLTEERGKLEERYFRVRGDYVAATNMVDD